MVITATTNSIVIGSNYANNYWVGRKSK